MPWEADALLSRIDRFLFLGANPALLAEGRTTPGVLEFFSFVYAWFIPYLYLSLFLGFVGRTPAESDELLTGFALTYAVSYLGYLFLPARGPVIFHAADFAGPLRGGAFHDLVVASTAATGGNHGAFPSLHVGAAAYVCLFDLRHNRLRGLTYVPLVLLIAVSTVFVRYHYVVDLLAGLAIAVAANRAAPRWLAVWQRRTSPRAHRPPPAETQ
jgi:membrane-associated phospholipid phosphatase